MSRSFAVTVMVLVIVLSAIPVARSAPNNPLAGKTVEFRVEVELNVTSGLLLSGTRREAAPKGGKMTITRDGNVYVFTADTNGNITDQGHIYKLNGQIDFLANRERAHPDVFKISTFQYWKGKVTLDKNVLTIITNSDQTMNANSLRTILVEKNVITFSNNFSSCVAASQSNGSFEAPLNKGHFETVASRSIFCAVK